MVCPSFCPGSTSQVVTGGRVSPILLKKQRKDRWSSENTSAINLLVFISGVISGERVGIIVIEIIAGCWILEKVTREHNSQGVFLKRWDEVGSRQWRHTLQTQIRHGLPPVMVTHMIAFREQRCCGQTVKPHILNYCSWQEVAAWIYKLPFLFIARYICSPFFSFLSFSCITSAVNHRNDPLAEREVKQSCFSFFSVSGSQQQL